MIEPMKCKRCGRRMMVGSKRIGSKLGKPVIISGTEICSRCRIKEKKELKRRP